MQCSKTQTKQYFKKQRGSDVEGEWKMAIVYRNMEKIVDLTKCCWGRCFLLVCNGSQLSMLKTHRKDPLIREKENIRDRGSFL